jgi:hypothetical protein
MTRLEHVFRRIRSDSNSPEFKEMLRRELLDMPYKFIFVSVLYPLWLVIVYAVTGDIQILVSAVILMSIWLGMMYALVKVVRITSVLEDVDEENPGPIV